MFMQSEVRGIWDVSSARVGRRGGGWLLISCDDVRGGGWKGACERNPGDREGGLRVLETVSGG